MRTTQLALLSAALLAGASAANATTITLDGSLADWAPSNVLYSGGEIAQSGTPDAAYSTVYVTNDATNLYVAWSTAGGNGGDINNGWTHNLYLDTDTNASTGFNAGWMAHGYDALVQYGAGGGSYSVFGFAGANQAAWGWSWAGLMNYSYSGSVAEYAIPLSMLGNPTAITMEFNNTGAAGGETWAAAPESSAKTYTVVVPEPASMSVLAVGLAALKRRR